MASLLVILQLEMVKHSSLQLTQLLVVATKVIY
jgi:hypothetical protein